MDHLWAGWRSEYIESVVAGDPSAAPPGGSVFTQILASGLPDKETLIVWRGDLVFAILNRFPYTSGHVLVMPYREVAELVDLTPDEFATLWAAVGDAVLALQAAYAPEGLNVGMNLGHAAGAGVPTHVHVHVLPRWKGDSSFMTSVANARVLPEALSVTWEKLRATWPVS
jgi:ATP adenylyltransferase